MTKPKIVTMITSGVQERAKKLHYMVFAGEPWNGTLAWEGYAEVSQRKRSLYERERLAREQQNRAEALARELHCHVYEYVYMRPANDPWQKTPVPPPSPEGAPKA